MKKIKEFKEKYFNQKVRNIISVFIILAGTIFMYYYCLLSPTIINKYIASNIYKAPANTYFDDQNFYNCVVDAYNSKNNTSLPYTTNLSDSQLASIKEMTCSGYKKANTEKVKSTGGLEKLTALTHLYVDGNNLTSLDLSKNTSLTRLDAENNQLTSIDVSKNTSLIGLSAYENNLTTLDVSKNTKLLWLYVSNNKLTSIDVSKNTALTSLSVWSNNLTTLDVSKNTALEALSVGINNLTTLDVSKNTSLKYLHADDNQLTTLDVSKNPALTSLYAYNNQLTTLDVSKNTSLTSLYAYNNQLTTLDVSKNTALTSLDVGNNQISEIDVSKNTSLTSLYAYNNQLTTLDVGNNTKLTELSASSNNLTSLDVSKNSALTNLSVWSNNLTTLDVTKNTYLSELYVSNTNITSLDISNNTSLKTLDVSNTKLTTLDASKNKYLSYLVLDESLISIIDLKSYTAELINVKIKFNKYIPKNYSIKVENVNKSVPTVPDNKIGIKKLDFNNLYWENKYSDNISVDNQAIYGKKSGFAKIIGYQYKLSELDKSSLPSISGKFVDENVEYYGPRREYNIYVYDIVSSEYVHDENNIYINNDSVKNVLDNIELDTGGVSGYSKSIDDNKLIIKHNDKVIKEYNLIKYNSSRYDLSKDNIVYINSFNINDIECTECNASVDNNKLVIKYKDSVIGSYNLLKINTEYKSSKNTIFTKGDLKYDEVKSCRSSCSSAKDQIECADKCDEVFDNNVKNILTKITSDDVDLSITNDELIVKYNNEEIKRYTLSDIDESFDVKDYNVNDDKYIISGIKIGTKINDFTSKIDTNVSYDIIDISGNVMTNEILKTGYKIRLAFSVEPMEYVLSIKGDVLGTGTITTTGAKLIARHIIDGNVIKENAYLDAADYNSDGVIKMNDVVRMLKENK